MIRSSQTDGGILDAHVAREAIRAPSNLVVRLLWQTIPAVRVCHQDILGRTLGSRRGVAVSAEVDVATVLLGFEIKHVTGTTAINGWTARRVIRVTRRWLEAAEHGTLVEIVIRSIGVCRRGRETAREDQLAIARRQRRHPLQPRARETAVVHHLVNHRHQTGRYHVERVTPLRCARGIVDHHRAINRQPLRTLGIQIEGVAAGDVKLEPTRPASRPVVIRQHSLRHAEALEVYLSIDARDCRNAQRRRQRVSNVIRRGQALRIRGAQQTIRSIDIHEQRISAEAVAVPEIRELPRRQRRTVALPEADLPGAGRVEQVVVTREAGLAFVPDAQPIAALHPDDVVAQMNVVRRRRIDAVRRGLVDGVVEDLIRTRPILRQANRRHAMIVEQVVGNRFRAAGVRIAVDAVLVRVNRVARERHRNVRRVNTSAHVPIDAAAGHLPLANDDAVVISVNPRVPHVQYRATRIGVDAVAHVVVNGRFHNGQAALQFNSRTVTEHVQAGPRSGRSTLLPDTRRPVVVNRRAVDRHRRRRDIEAPAVVHAGQVLDQAARASNDLHTVEIALMVIRRDVGQPEEIAVAIHEQAVARVVADAQAFGHERIGSSRLMQTVEAPGQREETNLHQVRVIQIHERLRRVVRNCRRELGHLAGVRRTAQLEATIQAQADIRLGRGDDRVNQRIDARVHVQHRAARQLVDAQHVHRIRLRRSRQLAGVAIRADRRRRVFVRSIAQVIHPIRVATLRHRELLDTAIHHRVVRRERHLDAQPVGAEADATSGRNPVELAVIRRGCRDGQQQRRAMHRIVLIQINADILLRDVVIGFPADEAGFVAFPVGVEIREAHVEMHARRLRVLGHGVAKRALVRCHHVIHHVSESAVEIAVVRGTGLQRRLEAILDLPRANRQMQPSADQLPAIRNILRRAESAHTDLDIHRVEEAQRQATLIFR